MKFKNEVNLRKLHQSSRSRLLLLRIFSKMIKFQNDSQKSNSDILKPYASVFGMDIEPLKAKIIGSPLGPLVVVSNEKKVLLLKNVTSKNLNDELKRLTSLYRRSIIENNDAKPLKLIESELNAYFKGELNEFRTPFEVNPNATDFQRSVWNEIYKIGYGSTITYSELAQRIGRPKSFRAVANACGRNPIAIVIPCHRVLASGNALGGYTGGLDKKITLLELENVKNVKY